MARNPRYDVLFEPVRIGPVTTKNRFYQVPHTSGGGHTRPNTRAGYRGMRAEGGWGVVNTGYCSIHPTSDPTPFPFSRLWDESDVKSLATMTEAAHEHGALAGVELWHGGATAGNRYSRETPISASGVSSYSHYVRGLHPQFARAMDRSDIRAFRQWQVDAAKRAKRAGFDIIYIYGGMGFAPFQFLLSRLNQRTDEYGGPIENRVRLLREMLEETKDAVGDTCAVAVRFSTDECLGEHGFRCHEEAREVVSLLADVPDLWDLKLAGGGANDCPSARFSEEGFQEPFVDFVKKLTDRPVVGVGRFTSPDAMVSQIRRGVLDLIGAARPSIADPFLPSKIDEGREDEIRECIGCNICIATWHEGAPIRCTQNPTAGEEWRRGWHPERMDPKGSDAPVLIVGAGPAGLECAMSLGRRGYPVTLAEAGDVLGGRLVRESALPGLGTWIRVRDYRVAQLNLLTNVEVYRASRLGAGDLLEFGARHIVLATGARWTNDLIGPHDAPIPAPEHERMLSADDVIAGADVVSPVVVYDYDHYYMGNVLAEKLRADGHEVTFVTPGNEVAAWTRASNEQGPIQSRLIDIGVTIVTGQRITGFDGQAVDIACVYSGNTSSIGCATVVVAGARRPDDALYHAIVERASDWSAAGIDTVTRIGDSDAPGAIAHAVHSGHRYARELDTDPGHRTFRPEHAVV